VIYGNYLVLVRMKVDMKDCVGLAMHCLWLTLNNWWPLSGYTGTICHHGF